MGIGDWGLGIGDWGLGPIPNPQSPIPNPQSPYIYLNRLILYKLFLYYFILIKFIYNYYYLNFITMLEIICSFLFFVTTFIMVVLTIAIVRKNNIYNL